MIKTSALALTLLAVSTPAFAQDAAPAAQEQAAAAPVAAKVGDKIYSSEGSLLGRVESLQKEGGAVTGVRIIYDSRFASFPLTSLAQGEKGLTVGMTRKEVARMR
ncbi:MAG: hypothetical protein AB7E60_10415 [Sphingobium sp.]